MIHACRPVFRVLCFIVRSNEDIFGGDTVGSIESSLRWM